MIEIMSFKLADGVSDEAFEAVDFRVQTDYAARQTGLLRRTTGHTADGVWIVIMVWRSNEDQEAAGENWGKDPATAEFGDFIDQASADTKYYDTSGAIFGAS
jgi:hypothetical protein